jgi:hypothetical protein
MNFGNKKFELLHATLINNTAKVNSYLAIILNI